MIITNSRYALVGYFITSYPTRANGIIVKYFCAKWRLLFIREASSFEENCDNCNSLHLARKYLQGYFSADIICSEKLTVFLELRSRKTGRFSEQMSADKYPSIFLRQMEAIVYLSRS